MSRNIHDVINVMDVRSIEISQAIAVQDDDVIMAMENIAAAKSTGNSHQNLFKKFFIILFVFLIVKTLLKPDYYKLSSI